MLRSLRAVGFSRQHSTASRRMFATSKNKDEEIFQESTQSPSGTSSGAKTAVSFVPAVPASDWEGKKRSRRRQESDSCPPHWTAVTARRCGQMRDRSFSVIRNFGIGGALEQRY